MTKLTTIQAAEEASYEEGDFQDVPPSDIVAYNELRSCADLYRMYEDESLDINPTFQREIAWKGPAQTRFIDSLIKQLPIPSLCFSYDYKKEEWQVIDGLQRISSVIRFLDSKSGWTLASLEDVDPRIANKPVSKFHEKGSELNKLKRRVENATLPITVLRCDPSIESHSNYLFTIFHRLNTGGIKLNNQEIRNCIYSGELNELLRELDKTPDWLAIHGLNAHVSDRFRRQEVILRFLAFYEGFELYKEGLAKFLNNFMRANKNPGNEKIERFRNLFLRVVSIVEKNLGERLREQRPNLSLLEALLVGVARNVDVVESLDKEALTRKYTSLTASPQFDEKALAEGLSKTVNVLGRMNAAVKTFS